MLENTKSFKHDKYLYNLGDPKIFKDYTKNEKKASKLWKKSYKWNYVKRIPGFAASSYVSSNESWTNMTICITKCIKMEKSQFAKKCEKSGGYFKCCVTSWGIEPYEINRNSLIEAGLINDNPTNICDVKSDKDPCTFCNVNGLCTKKKPLTGKTTHSFYPKMTENTDGR